MQEIEDFHTAILQDIDKNRASKQGDMPSWHDHFLDIWDVIKKAETARNEDVLMDHERTLKSLHLDYTKKIHAWVEQKSESSGHSVLPEDFEAKEHAKHLLPKYEKALHRYSLCFMHLNRILIHRRKDVQLVSKLLEVPEDKSPIEITDNIGFLLRRAYREKKRIRAERARLKKMQSCLKALDAYFERLEDSLEEYYGKDRSGRVMISFRGCLRQGQLEEAEKKFRQILSIEKPSQTCLRPDEMKQGIAKEAAQILSLMHKHKDDLKRESDYALNSPEINLSFNFLQTSEDRIDSFIDKYTARYLAFKYKALLKQAYRLGQIGSFERLFQNYQALLKGMITPYEREQDVQEYEKTVRHTEYILDSRASNLPNIFDEVDTASAELVTLTRLIQDTHQ